jgi:GNAT superfamily N-acetyltransferase
MDIPSIVWCNLTAKTLEEIIGYGPPLDQRIFANEERLERAWGSGNEVEGELAYVYEQVGKVVAFVVIRVEPDAIELDNIDVAKDFQGKGIGEALVRFVEDLARDLSKKYVTLDTSRNQETGKPWRSYWFWLRMGYSEDGEMQSDLGRQCGFTEIRFRKSIR